MSFHNVNVPGKTDDGTVDYFTGGRNFGGTKVSAMVSLMGFVTTEMGVIEDMASTANHLRICEVIYDLLTGHILVEHFDIRFSFIIITSMKV